MASFRGIDLINSTKGVLDCLQRAEGWKLSRDITDLKLRIISSVLPKLLVIFQE
jgi:hypothetical protein